MIRAAGMPPFIQNGAGAVARAYLAKVREVLSVQDFGAACDGSTDDTSAIQAAIDAVALLGGGEVRFPIGTTLTGPLTLKSGVILVGEGMNATTIRLKGSSNADFIQSENFSALTGQNKWLVSDGVAHGFGLRNLQLDGNKASQTSGDGAKFYGKRILVDNVLIRDVYGVGWYSEAGDVAGQTDWQDLPESHIFLWVRNCGSHGFQFRGPHDAVIHSLCSNQNAGKGVSFETSNGLYNGGADVNFVHSYANSDQGFFSSAQIRGQQIISENNAKEGFELTCWYSQFSMVQLYDNCRASGTWNAIIGGKYNVISQLQQKNATYLKSGVHVTGVNSTVRDIICEGNASTGTGVQIDSAATHSNVEGQVRGYNGVGGTGVVTNSGGACSYLKADFTIENCATCWNNSSAGYAGQYDIVIHAATGQTGFVGQGPNSTDCVERWNVVGQVDPSTLLLSEIRKSSGGDIDLNSTAEQVITVACSELLGLTPEPEDINFNIYYSGTNTAWELAYIRLSAVTSSLITFKVKLKTAAGSAETAKIIVRASL